MNNNKLIIRAHGFGFCSLLILYLVITITILICIVMSFLPKNVESIYSSWWAILLYCCGLILIIFEIIMLFKKGKVEFLGDEFINPGKYTNYFPPFKVSCIDIVSYELLAVCIVFTFSNGKKQNFHTMQFTKKQNLQILQEIQNRGGLQNQEIKLDNYYFNKKLKIKKNK